MFNNRESESRAFNYDLGPTPPGIGSVYLRGSHLLKSTLDGHQQT